MGGGSGDQLIVGSDDDSSQNDDHAAQPSGAKAAKASRSVKRSTPNSNLQHKLDAQEARREAFAESPKGHAERATSRTAYSNLSAERALKVSRTDAPALVTQPAWSPPPLKRGERVVGYKSEHVAQVDLPHARQDALVQSTLDPIAVERPGGGLRPVDLDLRPLPNGWKAANSKVDTLLPRSLKSGLTLTRPGSSASISLALTDRAVEGRQTDNGKLFYANADADTDVLLAPTPLGASVSWVLRSPAAPAVLAFKLLTNEDGTSAEVSPAGDLELLRDGKLIASATAPEAVDAQGTHVDAKFVVTDDGIRVQVDHKQRDLAYPIGIDPYISYYGVPAVQSDNGGLELTNWSFNCTPCSSFNTNLADMIKTEGLGVRLSTLLRGGVTGGAWGNWSIGSVRNSTIFRAVMTNMRHSAQYSAVYAGLASGGSPITAPGWSETKWAGYLNGSTCAEVSPGNIPGCQGNGAWGSSGSYSGLAVVACAAIGCTFNPTPNNGTPTGTPGNYSLMHMSFYSGTPSTLPPSASFRGGYLFFSDYSNPTINYVNNLPAPTGIDWAQRKNVQVQIGVSDPGVGLGAKSYGHAGAAIEPFIGGKQRGEFGPAACDGGNLNPCPSTYNEVWQPSNYEGDNSWEIKASDIIGHRVSNGVVQRKIDNTGPVIDISGRLGAFALETTPNGSRTLAEDAPYVIQATDGILKNADGSATDGTQRRSGVKKLDFSIKDSLGNVIPGGSNATDLTNSGASTHDCDATTPGDQDSCPLTLQGEFKAGSSLQPGEYTIIINASDWAGNTTSKTFHVAVGVAEFTSISEGQTTARYVPIKVKRTRGSATSFKLQYRPNAPDAWRDVPVCSDVLRSAVRVESSGLPVSSWPQPLGEESGTESSRFVLDMDRLRQTTDLCPQNKKLRWPDKELFIRAVLTGSGAESSRSSEDITINYDRGGRSTSDDVQSIGPGSVDLVTGNFQMSATDVSIDAFKGDLTVSRTYNSRYSDTVGVFGKGWEVGLPSEGAGADYLSAYDNADVDIPDELKWSGVEVTTVDGENITFELTAEPGVYKAQVGYESLRLDRVEMPGDPLRTKEFKLRDLDTGTVVTFGSKDAQTTGLFNVSDVSAPGMTDQVTYAYKILSDGKSRIEYAFAPTGGVNCRGAGETAAESWTKIAAENRKGCQALYFDYAPQGTAGDRLTKITLETYDPQKTGGAGFIQQDVAQYEYSAGQLAKSFDPRDPGRYTQYTYTTSGTQALIASVTPAGEEPYTFAYGRLPDDQDDKDGRLARVSRSALTAGTANWDVRYYVPTSASDPVGSNAPYDLSDAAVAKWGQDAPPWTATAVFSPDAQPNGTPASNYGAASISYLNSLGQEVNSAQPGGRIGVTEYDKWGNVTRTLTPENRARAMAQPSDAQKLAAAEKWDTQNNYDYVPGSPSKRRHLVDTFGPEHSVRIADTGDMEQARQHTKVYYDEGISLVQPDTLEPFDLATTQVESARVGSSDFDSRATTTSYGETTDETLAELKLRLPREVVADAGSGKLNIKSKVSADADGLVTERYQPRSQSSGQPSTTKIAYYTAGTNSEAACGNHPEWLGLPCKTGPAGQPATSGLPQLPTQTITYNYLRQPLVASETVVDANGQTQTRTTTKTYSLAGRVQTEEIESSLGTPIKKTQHIYNAAGNEIQTRALNSDGTVSKSVSRYFDTLGRQYGYVDASGNTSTTTFDILSRPVAEGDPKATRTNYYDATTGDRNGLIDSGLQSAGYFVASFDADGRIVSEAMPAGLAKSSVYDAAGNVTSLTYTRTSGCSTGCNWLVNTAEYNIHGQMVAQDGLPNSSGGGTNQKYSYDGVGRLSEVQDTAAGQCTVRRYEFDADSNRTAKKTYAPGSGGACDTSTSPTTKSNTFDEADRIINAGYEYDAFGRTTTVPQVDAGGTGNMTATYYANDLARSITQDGKTQTLDLDPMLRAQTKTKSGGWSGTQTYAYSDDSDSPAWLAEGSNWTRWIAGLDGSVDATQKSDGSLAWTVSNIRGDMIAEAGGAGLMNVREIDEFGNAEGGLPSSRPYGFHGSKERETLTDGGTIAMGVRLYVPGSGRFLQTDPVLGGSAGPYDYTNQDPINLLDLNGQSACFKLCQTVSRGARWWQKTVARGGRKALRYACLAWGTHKAVKTIYYITRYGRLVVKKIPYLTVACLAYGWVRA